MTISAQMFFTHKTERQANVGFVVHKYDVHTVKEIKEYLNLWDFTTYSQVFSRIDNLVRKGMMVRTGRGTYDVTPEFLSTVTIPGMYGNEKNVTLGKLYENNIIDDSMKSFVVHTVNPVTRTSRQTRKEFVSHCKEYGWEYTKEEADSAHSRFINLL